MENNNIAERVVWTLIFSVTIVMIGIFGRNLLFESYEEGRVEEYPTSNITIEMKSSVLTTALSKCEWCEVRTNTQYITIIATDTEEFDRIINPNDFAAQSAKMFPEMFEFERVEDKPIFIISRNFKLRNGGTLYIPAWLLHSLIDNNILTSRSE